MRFSWALMRYEISTIGPGVVLERPTSQQPTLSGADDLQDVRQGSSILQEIQKNVSSAQGSKINRDVFHMS